MIHKRCKIVLWSRDFFAHTMHLKSWYASIDRLAFWDTFDAKITLKTLAQERNTYVNSSSVCVITNLSANSMAVAP